MSVRRRLLFIALPWLWAKKIAFYTLFDAGELKSIDGKKVIFAVFKQSALEDSKDSPPGCDHLNFVVDLNWFPLVIGDFYVSGEFFVNVLFLQVFKVTDFG